VRLTLRASSTWCALSKSLTAASSCSFFFRSACARTLYADSSASSREYWGEATQGGRLVLNSKFAAKETFADVRKISTESHGKIMKNALASRKKDDERKAGLKNMASAIPAVNDGSITFEHPYPFKGVAKKRQNSGQEKESKAQTRLASPSEVPPPAILL
jgi:hypothetical protein